MDAQRQIRENAAELQDYIKSLNSWEQDMKAKEKSSKGVMKDERDLPPIRNSGQSDRVQAVEDNASAALREKDKGNEYFNQGKFSEAVARYTRAINLDPTNPILPANRAMANLKLRNFNEAEIDCTKAITLDPQYVKAYQRRGVARQFLKLYDDAIKDFQIVLKAEPSNKQATDELQKTQKLKNQESQPPKQPQTKAPTPSNTSTATSVTQSTKPTPPPITPQVAKHPASVQLPVQSEPTIPHKRLTITEVDEDDAKSAEPVITPTTSSTPSTISSTPVVKPSIVISAPTQAPRTAFEFDRVWHSLSGAKDLSLLAQYIRLSNPSTFPVLFKDSMSSDAFFGILNVIEQYFIPEKDFSTALSLLDNMRKVGRFDMLVMFMSDAEKKVLSHIFVELERVDEPEKVKLTEIKSKYDVR